MLTTCPKCEFIFEYSSRQTACPRCNFPVEAPEECTAPSERCAVPQEQTSKPESSVPGYRLIQKEPEVSEDCEPVGATDTTRQDALENQPMAPLKRRALAQVYDNLELGIYLSAGTLATILFVQLRFYFSRPTSLGEINSAISWMTLFLIVFFAAVFYYLQIHTPYRNGGTHGQDKYGLMLLKESRFTYGTFIARALGQSLGLTILSYVFTRLFRRNAPGNDEIRGAEDVFSGTRQVVAGKVKGKPVTRLVAIILVIVIVILAIVLTISLTESRLEKWRGEDRAKREAFKQRQAAVVGFDDLDSYVAKVNEARRSCTDGTCVSSYQEYKSAYMNPIKEMGRQTDDIFLYYSRPSKGNMQLDRISDEEAIKTIELMLYNGICFRKELIEDKLITEDTLDASRWSLMKNRGILIKNLDSKCPVRDPSLLP